MLKLKNSVVFLPIGAELKYSYERKNYVKELHLILHLLENSLCFLCLGSVGN